MCGVVGELQSRPAEVRESNAGAVEAARKFRLRRAENCRAPEKNSRRQFVLVMPECSH